MVKTLHPIEVTVPECFLWLWRQNSVFHYVAQVLLGVSLCPSLFFLQRFAKNVKYLYSSLYIYIFIHPYNIESR
ncbi:hypothetical protein XELAEV_18020470mg [Xenopus laevis]|uniref:Uncharacterized protein n=1 Tax=Xenopus laevis TaxID=8355 RepID=A0A974D9S1_XENLA|nr:hypothetical protein XELAEV_18020470mg [Xenopus laevis]